jgi:two-component system phosphate regulon response regulator PhoB
MKNLRVLVVDDESFERNLYKLMFGADGTEVESASDGDEAVIKAISFKPDIIVLDLNLGESSGFDVIRRLRKLKETKNIPVIFVSGDADAHNVKKGYFLGAVDYLQKGNDVVRMVKYIRELALLESISSNLQRVKEILDR